jgi:catechol 2,3-dioxygenase-like lactoylglutathione lyase family enzyme
MRSVAVASARDADAPAGRGGITNGEPMKMTRLIPMLPVRSMPASVDFYCGMLGFEVEKRDDHWGWAMLRFDECRLMVDQSINAHPSKSRDAIDYLYPDDVAAYHQQVRKNGLVVPELDVTFYGLTEFRINDPDGNRLWIGQNTSSGT